MISVDPANTEYEIVQSTTPGHSNNRVSSPSISTSKTGSTTREQKESFAKHIDDYQKAIGKDLRVEINQKNGDVIFKVISRKDGRVVREIHSKSYTPGLLFRHMV